MTVARIALGAVAAALVAAEFVRPTPFAPKKISHLSLAALRSGAPLDREALDDLPPIVTPALGNIDAATVMTGARARPLTPGAAMGPADVLQLTGWCADPDAHAAPPTLLAIVDGRRRIDESAAYHRARADVAAFFNAPAMADTGFTIRLSGADLGPGAHTVRVAVIASDQRGVFVFPTPETVTVTTGAAP